MGGQRPQFPPAAAQKLTAQQQQEAIQTIAGGGGCPICGGIHAAEAVGLPAPVLDSAVTRTG